MAVSMGADDFIAKPFDLDVLTVKIQAIIRRCYDSVSYTHLDVYKRQALKSGIVNKVYAYIAPKLFGGADAKTDVYKRQSSCYRADHRTEAA